MQHSSSSFLISLPAASLRLLTCTTALTCGAVHSQIPATPTLQPVEVHDAAITPGSSLGLDVPTATGSRLGLTLRETPASVSSFSRADMAERSITRAQDAVVRLPGMTESPAPGNGGTRLAARGFLGHNSVAQMVDGSRLTVAVRFPPGRCSLSRCCVDQLRCCMATARLARQSTT